jgi:nucleoside-diphosphate-sugar epimerase
MEMVLTPGAGVVVTGASGFIGRAVCAHLAAQQWRVRGLVRKLEPMMAARAELLPVGDLATMSVESLADVMRDATAIVHLAARVHRLEDVHPSSRDAYRRANVDVTQRLARAGAAAGVRHFVFASSVKVNGEVTMPGRPFRESDPPDPHDDYAASKWEAERMLADVAEQSGMRVTALRLPLTYGPDAKANFAQLVHAVAQGRPLPFARIANRRSLLGVRNLASAVERVLADEQRADQHHADAGRVTAYFVADAVPVSTPDLVRAIAAALGVAPRLFAVPAGLLQLAGACTGRSAAIARLTRSLEVDSTAFRERFGWQAPWSLAEGLAGLHDGRGSPSP